MTPPKRNRKVRNTAEQLGLNLTLIVASKSTGGVMDKMIDAQSIVVAAVATGQCGGEGKILQFVFLHSVILAALVGALTMLQAYVLPWMIPPDWLCCDQTGIHSAGWR